MASHRSRRIAAAFLALGGIALAGLASAAQFGLSMTRVHLDASHPVETIGVTNRDAEPTSFEVHVQRWRQAANGEWQLVPDEGLVVHPLIVTMQAGETARVRVGSLSPSVKEEEAYRIELAELPDRAKQQPGMVRMLARISIPVFVQVPNGKAALGASVEALKAHDATFVLRNTGTAYSPPQGGKLRILDADGKTLQESDITTPYVLAGAQAPLTAKLSGNACTRAAKVELVLDKGAPIAVPVAPGARRCAP